MTSAMTTTPRLLLALGLLLGALGLPAAPARAEGDQRIEAHVDLHPTLTRLGMRESEISP